MKSCVNLSIFTFESRNNRALDLDYRNLALQASLKKRWNYTRSIHIRLMS